MNMNKKYSIVGAAVVGLFVVGNVVTHTTASSQVAEQVAAFNEANGKDMLRVGEVSHWLFGSGTVIHDVQLHDRGTVVKIDKVVADGDGEYFDTLSFADVSITHNMMGLDASLSHLSLEGVDVNRLKAQVSKQADTLSHITNNVFTLLTSRSERMKKRAMQNLLNQPSIGGDASIQPGYTSLAIEDITMNMPMLQMQFRIDQITSEFGDITSEGTANSGEFALRHLTMSVPESLKQSHFVFNNVFADGQQLDVSMDGTYEIDDDNVNSSFSVVEESIAKLSFEYDFAVNMAHLDSFITLLNHPRTNYHTAMKHDFIADMRIDEIAFSLEERGAVATLLAPLKANPKRLQQQIEMVSIEAEKYQAGLGDQLKSKLTAFFADPSKITLRMSQNADIPLADILALSNHSQTETAALQQAFTINID